VAKFKIVKTEGTACLAPTIRWKWRPGGPSGRRSSSQGRRGRDGRRRRRCDAIYGKGRTRITAKIINAARS